MKELMGYSRGKSVDLTVSSSKLKNEASMNFDLENVVPFLAELNANFKLDLDVKMLGEFSASIPANAGKSIVVDILDAGRETKMEFQVFMDDIDAPDVYMFFDSSELSESVGDFMMSWAEARGL